MSEKRFYKLNSRFVDIEEPVIYDNFEQKALNIEQSVELLNKLYEENEQLRNELTFLNKVISFFADNPMTKYSSKSELLEEMKLLEEMGLI